MYENIRVLPMGLDKISVNIRRNSENLADTKLWFGLCGEGYHEETFHTPVVQGFTRFQIALSPLNYSLRKQAMASDRDGKLEKLLIITRIADTDMHISKCYCRRKIH